MDQIIQENGFLTSDTEKGSTFGQVELSIKENINMIEDIILVNWLTQMALNMKVPGIMIRGKVLVNSHGLMGATISAILKTIWWVVKENSSGLNQKMYMRVNGAKVWSPELEQWFMVIKVLTQASGLMINVMAKAKWLSFKRMASIPMRVIGPQIRSQERESTLGRIRWFGMRVNGHMISGMVKVLPHIQMAVNIKASL